MHQFRMEGRIASSLSAGGYKIRMMDWGWPWSREKGVTESRKLRRQEIANLDENLDRGIDDTNGLKERPMGCGVKHPTRSPDGGVGQARSQGTLQHMYMRPV